MRTDLALGRGATLILVMWMMVGCAGREPTLPVTPAQVTPLPSYDVIYEGAERRVGTLDRLWASAVTSLRYVDAQGDRRRDQGEGHFQLKRPDSLAVFIGKLGETYLILGSDSSRFWWIELLEDRVAFVGQQSEARASAEAALGVPVLPGDLILALDLARWPEPGSPRVLSVEWSTLDGLDPTRTVAVTLDEAGRSRRIHVDAVSLDPLAVELATAEGEVFAVSRLSQHGRVLNRVGAKVEPRIPMRAEVDLLAADARIELSLSRAALDPRKPRDAVFNLEILLDRFRVGIIRAIEPSDGQP